MRVYIYIYMCVCIYICIHCTTEEGDRVVVNFSCVIIVIMKFVDQDIIEFAYCFICICTACNKTKSVY